MRNLKIKTKKSDITEKYRVKDKIIGYDGGKYYRYPLVYLNLTKDGKQVCPYCSKIYILKNNY